MELRFAMS